MSSNFQLTLKLNSVQCLFLMQWNIAAQGNFLKKGQRVGQLCRETNDVWLMMDGKRACRRISLLLVSHKLSAAFFRSAAFFSLKYFCTKFLSHATKLYSEIHFIMLIQTHFSFITKCFNDTLKCACQKHIFKIKIFIWYIVMNATELCALVQ